MVGDIFPSRLQDPKRVSEREVGTIKSSGIEDAQEIGSRPSQQTLSASFSLDATPEGLEYGTDANGSAAALSGALARLPGDPPDTVCISALERAREKSTIWLLPGQGAAAVGCGEGIPYHCNHHDGGVWKRSHCNERGCPRCYERWAALEAHAASKRIAWGAKYWQNVLWHTILGLKVLIGHFVVSLPSEQSLYCHNWSPEKARSLVYEICRAHRIIGGAVIFHPWRRDDDLKEYVPDGYWHFHIIGVHFIPTTPGGSDIGPDGRIIVFKHIKDDEYQNYGGVRSQRGLGRLIQYQLTHAGLKDGSHALTYFGRLSYNKLPTEEVQRAYEDALLRDSKADPAVPSVCPCCGSVDLEPCSYKTFVGREGLIDIASHPPPEHVSSPELVDEAEQQLEEKFQNLYDNEPDPEARHRLTQERQQERGRLRSRELELFNLKDPLVELWVWLRTILEDGSQLRDDLQSDVPALLDRVIELNLSTGRLGATPQGRLYLKHEYELDDALRDLRGIVQHGEPIGEGDWRLERLIAAAAPEGNHLLTDYGFVFDETFSTNQPGESSHLDRNFDDASIENRDEGL